MRRALTVLTALAALFLVGCGASHSSSGGGTGAATTPATQLTHGGDLMVATDHDVSGFNQFTITDNDSIRVAAQITEGLYKTNAQGKVVPWLATADRVSDHGLVHTLPLRRGVEFSDGRPMTAADVVFTLQHAKQSPSEGSLFSDIVSLSAPNPHTVVIKLKTPSAALHATLALFVAGIVPAHFGGHSGGYFNQHPMGTGPFRLGTWDKGTKVVLVRNSHYWMKSRPVVNEVQVIGVADNNSRLAQLQGHQVDIEINPPWPEISNLKRSPGLRVGTYAPSEYYGLALNTKHAPFTSLPVRKAISEALDRAAMVKAALANNGEPANSFIAPSVPYASGPKSQPVQDAQARRLISSAGSAVHGSLQLDIVSGDSVSSLLAQIIQQNLKTIGLKVTIVPLDAAAVNTDLDKGNYAMLITPLTSDILDPSELSEFYVGTGGFWTGNTIKGLQSLVNRAVSEANPTKRAGLYATIQREVYDQYALVPLVVAPWAYAFSDRVQDFSVNGTGIPDFSTVGLQAGSS